MPKLWNQTIEAHRRDVRAAILEATAALVAEHGLRSVTMSQIAVETGIGRATLYKYFSSVEAILTAWHGRQIGTHFAQLTGIGARAGSAGERLATVLQAYAEIAYESRRHHDTELAAFLHRDAQVAEAQRQLYELVRRLLEDGVASGDVRGDIAPDELANYCLNALGAASSLPSKAAAGRLVTVILGGLQPRA